MEHVIDDCQQLLSKVSDPINHPPYNEISDSPALKYSRATLTHYRQTLISARGKLNSLWRRSEEKVLRDAKILKYKAKADKVYNIT